MVMKLKVAHLIGALRTGGAEQQVVMILNQLDSRLFEKFVIVLNDKKFINNLRPYLNQNVGYYSLGYRRGNAFWVALKLSHYLRKNNIDILHSHMYHASWVGAIAKLCFKNLIMITTEHGQDPWKKWHHHYVEKYIINRAANLRTAVSEDIRHLLIINDGVRPDKIICIPNGTSMPEYTADTARLPRVVGSLARLVEAKDFPTLFMAMRHVRERGYPLELWIAGEGKERTNLLKCIQELKMEHSIKLLGFQKADRFLKEIDVFAMSSIQEGLPVALLEAMSHGLPIVATDVGGIGEVIANEQDGLLSPPQDPLALARNIIKIVEDKKLRMHLGKNAKQKISDKYSIESTTAQ